MLLIYTSRTSNIDRFVASLGVSNTLKITTNYLPTIVEPFWLITYTDVLGQVPAFIEQFLQVNHKNLKGVGAAGNLNFGNNFAYAANLISEKYNVPIVIKFELSGTAKDRQIFKEKFLAAGGF